MKIGLLVVAAALLGSVPLSAQVTVFDAPLTFTAADGSPSANALLEVEVAGQRTLLILDNGAGYQTFAAPFARKHELPVKGRIIGLTDHSGASLNGLRLNPFPLRIGSYMVTLERGAAFDLPASFEKQGIAGLISPVTLIDSGYVVLDMPNARMYGLRADSAAALSWLRGLGYKARRIATRVDPGGDLYLPMSLNNRYDTWSALDLGSAYTYFTAKYSGVATSKDCVMTGISGDCVGGAVSNGHDVRLAGRTYHAMPIRVTEKISGAANTDFRVEGLIGMDVLRNCALALPHNPAHPVYMSCQPSK